MDAIKQQLLKVQQQLAGLSASQKMLTASLLVIMVMTLFYWSHFAGTSDMEAVIDKPLTSQEQADVRNAVVAKGITAEIRGDRVYVPTGKKAEAEAAMSDLAFDGKLPTSYDKAADEADDQENPLASPAAREQHLQEKRRRRVETMISRWPGVTRAEVILAGEKKIGIMSGENPTGSVSLTVADGANQKRLAESSRTLVARAQPGLNAAEVGIVINGRDIKPEDANNPFGDGGILATQLQFEKSYQDKIVTQLHDIPNVLATVSVDLQTKTSYQTAFKPDPKSKMELLRNQTSDSSETTVAAPAGEPGMSANVGQADSQSGPKGGTTSDKTSITNDTTYGFVSEQTQSPAGTAVAKTASVRLPRSHFKRIWKSKNPKAAVEGSEAEIDAVVNAAKPDILRNVMFATNIVDQNMVSVSTYDDLPPDVAPDSAATSTLASLPMTSGFGAKEIAVGELAVISLFMVSMMVRKAQPVPILAVPTPEPMDNEPTGPQMLRVADIAGEVAEGNITLAGQELTEEALEAKQVIEQVGTMVKSNPDVAANLVKRWLNQD